MFYGFSSTKSENNRSEEVLPRSGVVEVKGEVVQIMYTHASKCKNNKIKFYKKEKVKTYYYLETSGENLFVDYMSKILISNRNVHLAWKCLDLT
jgi:hypothetical protein